MRGLILAIFVAAVALPESYGQCPCSAYNSYAASPYGTYPQTSPYGAYSSPSPYGALGAGCGGYGRCGGCQQPQGPCDARIYCDSGMRNALMSQLPSSVFCGPCCDPISACLFKKLRDYSLDKKKFLAEIILKKNCLVNKLLCGC